MKKNILTIIMCSLIFLLSGCQNKEQNDAFEKKMGIFISPTISEKIVSQQIMAAKKIGVNYVRIPVDQMPFNGEYKQKTKLVNYAIFLARQQGFQVVVNFTGGNPGNYSADKDYYDKLVSQIKGDIKTFVRNNSNKGIVWESWNEPQGEFWSNNASRNIAASDFTDEWISMNNYISRIVSKYDVDSSFINGDFSGTPINNVNFINLVLNSEGIKNTTAISFHPYLKKSVNNGRPEMLLQDFPMSTSIPFLVTEFGYPIKTDYSKTQERYLGLWTRKEQAEYLARATIIFNMLHMPYYVLFTTSLDHDNFGVEHNGHLNKAGQKLRLLNKSLSGYSYSRYYRYKNTLSVVFTKKFNPDKIVSWSTDDQKHTAIVHDSKLGNLKFITTAMPIIKTQYSIEFKFFWGLLISIGFGGLSLLIIKNRKE